VDYIGKTLPLMVYLALFFFSAPCRAAPVGLVRTEYRNLFDTSISHESISDTCCQKGKQWGSVTSERHITSVPDSSSSFLSSSASITSDSLAESCDTGIAVYSVLGSPVLKLSGTGNR
jgi:hypothetical protein